MQTYGTRWREHFRSMDMLPLVGFWMMIFHVIMIYKDGKEEKRQPDKRAASENQSDIYSGFFFSVPSFEASCVEYAVSEYRTICHTA